MQSALTLRSGEKKEVRFKAKTVSNSSTYYVPTSQCSVVSSNSSTHIAAKK